MKTGRHLFFFSLFILSSFGLYAQSADLDSTYASLNKLYKQYIEDGLVEYDSLLLIQHDVREIRDELVRYYDDFTDQKRKAYLINLYNFEVIHRVLEHYPIRSVEQVDGFFTRPIRDLPRKLSLDDLEKNLMQTWDDPRVHFVLICAAEGCPPFPSEVFRGKTLEQRLESISRQVLNDVDYVRVLHWRKQVRLPRIFEWYSSDFGGSNDILPFINEYRDSLIPSDYQIRYYPYDWRLNNSGEMLSIQPGTQGNLLPYRASALMQQGLSEFKWFNSIYTQRQFDGYPEFNSRSTYFSSFFQFLHGVDENLNVGFDLVYKSNAINVPVAESPLEVFAFQREQKFQRVDEENDTLRYFKGDPIKSTYTHGLSHFGPKFKIPVLKKIPGLAFQQTLYVPLNTDVDGAYISFSQLFFDRPIGDDFQLFAEASLWWPMAENRTADAIFRVFFSHFVNRKLTVYGMSNIPYEYGAGLKYYLVENLELELLYTKYAVIQPWVDLNNRPETFNLGIRYVLF